MKTAIAGLVVIVLGCAFLAAGKKPDSSRPCTFCMFPKINGVKCSQEMSAEQVADINKATDKQIPLTTTGHWERKQ